MSVFKRFENQPRSFAWWVDYTQGKWMADTDKSWWIKETDL